MTNQRIVLELDWDSEPVSGWLHLEDGRAVPFTGYLAFLAALDALRADTPKEPA